jgi:chemotaxis protein methyltransferase CheR
MSNRVHPPEVEAEAIPPLLEAIYGRYGLDFRDYALSSLRRRVRAMLHQEHLASVDELRERVLADRDCLERVLPLLSIHTTSMFRDPDVFRVFRREVVPCLREQPYIRVWHAGCSTGEEVYSFAILLHEEGLYRRCRIYATDINAAALRRARLGVYPLAHMRDYTQHYHAAGGEEPFSDYYDAAYGYARFHPALRRNVVFGRHNLVTDTAFHSFHLVICRNVLIYFNDRLQERVLRLLHDSLEPSGFLVLGTRESLQFTAYEGDYRELSPDSRIYCQEGQQAGILAGIGP